VASGDPRIELNRNISGGIWQASNSEQENLLTLCYLVTDGRIRQHLDHLPALQKHHDQVDVVGDDAFYLEMHAVSDKLSDRSGLSSAHHTKAHCRESGPELCAPQEEGPTEIVHEQQ
jgi:hypothetical protein